MKHSDFCAQFIPNGGRVLDVGSGRGKLVIELAARQYQVSGIEISPEYVAESKQKAAEAGLEIALTQGVAEQLPYPDNYFDFLNCAEVTEHVVDPVAICQEMHRVLKPGGRAYISFHNRFGIYDYHYHLYGINWLPRAWTEPVLGWLGKQKSDGTNGRQKLTTMHYFTFKQTQTLLATIGFEVEDVRVSKIKQKFTFLAPLVLIVYYGVFRPLYFNAFHIVVHKQV